MAPRTRSWSFIERHGHPFELRRQYARQRAECTHGGVGVERLPRASPTPREPRKRLARGSGHGRRAIEWHPVAPVRPGRRRVGAFGTANRRRLRAVGRTRRAVVCRARTQATGELRHDLLRPPAGAPPKDTTGRDQHGDNAYTGETAHGQRG